MSNNLEGSELQGSVAKPSQLPTIAGFALTTVYVVGMLIYTFFQWDELLKMKPNEFGDFMAGAFGPLALFWLVCGYLQQGQELRQSTEVLRSQATELQLSVRHQEQMAETARSQFNLENQRVVAERLREEKLLRKAEPKLEIISVRHRSIDGRGYRSLVDLCIKNVGANLKLLEHRSEGLQGYEIYDAPVGDLKPMGRLVFSFRGPPDSYTAEAFIYLVLEDQLERRHHRSIKLIPDKGEYHAELVPAEQAAPPPDGATLV